MAEAEISDDAMEETNKAIRRYLDFCHDKFPSEREIENYLHNNPFKEAIQRFIESCRDSYYYVPSQEIHPEIHPLMHSLVKKDWDVLLFICKQFGLGPHDLAEIRPHYSDFEEIYLIHLLSISPRTQLKFGTDEHRRLCTLEIRSDFFSTNEFRCIGHLDHLRELVIKAIEDTRTSPNEIYFPLDDVTNELRHLDIYMNSYSEKFRRLVTSVAFPHLTHLKCEPEVSPIMHRCESLEVLRLVFGSDSVEKNDEVVERLLVRDCPFTERLRSLEFHASSMTTDQFERMLFQVVPRFPNLESLEFDVSREWVLNLYHLSLSQSEWLDPKSYIKAAADRIRSDKSIRISRSLRKLSFTNLFNKRSVTEEEERLNMITFLKTFYTIDRFCLRPNRDIAPEAEYFLVTNMAGRRLLAEANRQNLGLWPVLLEAAQKDLRIEKGLSSERWQLRDGIFGLLREFSGLVAGRLGNLEVQSSPPQKRPRRKL